jgi:tape measure domain-containing protein
MMPKPLRFVFQMMDRFSPVAKRAISTLTKIQRLMTSLGQKSRALSSNFSNFFTAAQRSARGFLGTLGSIRRSIFNVQNLLAGVAVAGLFGGVIRAGTFSENTKTAFELQLGSKALANSTLEQAVSFAAKTPFETGTVIDAYQKLLAAQFTLAEVPVVLSGVGDLAAIKGFDPEVIERVVRALGQIRGKGRLQAEELLQLSEVGLPSGKVYEVLAGKLGITTDAVRKLQEAGKITSEMGVWAVLETIRTTFSDGKLGNAMDQFSKTLSGLWSTVRSRPLEMLIGFDETKGYKQLKGFVGNVANLFDPKGKNGQRIKTSVQGMFSVIFSTLFGPLEKLTREEVASKWIDKILSRAAKATLWFKKNWPTIVEYAKAFGEGFTQGLRDVYNIFKPVIDLFGDFQDPLDNSYTGVAKLIGRLLPLWLAFGFVASALAPVLTLLGGLSGTGGLIGLLTKLSPQAWLVVGILTALGVAAVWAYNHWEPFKILVDDTVQAIVDLVEAVKSADFMPNFLESWKKLNAGSFFSSGLLPFGMTGVNNLTTAATIAVGMNEARQRNPLTVTAPAYGGEGHKSGGGWGAEPTSTKTVTNYINVPINAVADNPTLMQALMDALEQQGVTELGDIAFPSGDPDRNR